MKHKLPIFFLCLLFVAGSCTGCIIDKISEDNREKPTEAAVSVSAQEDHTSRGAILAVAGKNSIESLALNGSQLQELAGLQIIKFRNGMFFGLGHDPAGDDRCLKSVYQFDFNGNHTEQIDGSRCFYSEIQEFPQGSGIFYYIQAVDSSETAQFKRMNYNTFRDEVLLDTGNITPDDIASFFANGRSVYYLDRKDGCIWRQRFSDGGKEKICPSPVDASAVERIYVCGNSIYLLQNDFCLKQSIDGITRETVIEGRILSLSDHEIYFLNSRNIICIYNMYSGKTSETGIFSLITRPCAMGRWTAILTNPGNKVYIWDTEQQKVTMQISHEKIRHLSGACGGRYFLYTGSGDRLGLIDAKEQTDRLINVAAFAEIAEDPIDRWFIDDKYLYAQDICDSDPGKKRSDAFYRIDLSKLAPASADPDTSI